MVKEVMDRTGVASLIPVYDDLAAAKAALLEGGFAPAIDGLGDTLRSSGEPARPQRPRRGATGYVHRSQSA